jgi:hypothetical protein
MISLFAAIQQYQFALLLDAHGTLKGLIALLILTTGVLLEIWTF